MTTLLLTHPFFVEHDTGPGHPERPDRMRAIDKVLAHELFKDLKREEAPLRDDVEEQIALAHPRAYIDWVKSVRPAEGEEPVRLDPDTRALAQVLGAGAAGGRRRPRRRRPRDGQELRHRQRVLPGAPLRPSRRERARHGLLHLQQRRHRRPLRAQEVRRRAHRRGRFRRAPRQRHAGHLLVATRTSTSAPRTRCRSIPAPARCPRPGVGNIWNAPLRPGDGGDRFKEAFESRILPALRNFGPDIVLISAGFDAHQDDPLANLRLHRARFRLGDEQDRRDRRQACQGRLVSMLEGGYNLAALAKSVGVHVKALMDAGS